MHSAGRWDAAAAPGSAAAAPTHGDKDTDTDDQGPRQVGTRPESKA